MIYRTSGEGYEYVAESKSSTPAYIHRLCAVAEYGFDAVTGEEDVHHRDMWDGGSVPFINGRDVVQPEDWVEHRKRTLNNVQSASD